MRRKAQRQTPREKARIAKSIASRGLQSIAAKGLARQLNEKLALGFQELAVLTVNELVEVGPGWSGEFAASWDVVPDGVEPKATRNHNGESIYNYSKRNFPASRFLNALESNKLKFSIVNTSPHAEEAIDMVKARFSRPSNDPVKEDTLELGDGRDQPSFRYEIGESFNGFLEDAPAARTAEPDWFYLYVEGGGLNGAIKHGLEIGFKMNYSSGS
jgi:hypothetical protein